ncbi:MAG: hypothetical protein K2Q18_19690 [Bdellovibrionales bacterium]|nr:hypothetical protein [Bdellovibrionales bacterium]
MRYFKIIFLTALVSILSSCGKPPIFNKLEINSVLEVTRRLSLGGNFISLTWIVPPSTIQLSSFTVKLESPLPSNMSLHAYIDMPEMGHGSSPIEMNNLNELEYVFSEVSFFMSGLWVLHIELLENNTVVDEWQRSYILQ